jgi:protein O-mannosyl-transferase
MDATAPQPPHWLAAIAIAILTFAVFAPTLTYGFVYDDYAQIVETKQLNSWRMIPTYFTGHVWKWKAPNEKGVYYRPVFLLWLLLNQSLFGLSAPMWHLTNILVHVLATVLVYALAREITGDTLTATITGLFFGLHPAHIESVAWASGITDPLLAVFLFASLLLFLKDQPVWSLVLFALALLEKETAIVLPVLVFVYAFLFPRGNSSRLRSSTQAALPYFCVALVYLGVRLAVMKELTSVLTPVPFGVMLLTWPLLIVSYLKHLVWPSGLSLFYDFRLVQSAASQNFLEPGIILLVVGAALLLFAWRSRFVAFGAALLFLPLLPALNLRTFADIELFHDRYLYIPVAGFAFLAALAIRHLAPSSALPSEPRTSVSGLPLLQLLLTFLISAGLAFGTILQSRPWRENITLFQRGIEIAPNNAIAYQCMGTSLLLKASVAEAIPFYQHALQLNPNMPESLYSLGRSYYELNMFPEAEIYLDRALHTGWHPAMAALYYGMSKYKQGDLNTAESALRFALQSRGPDDYREYHLGLGLVLKDKGDFAGALQEFQAEVRENPDPSKAIEQIADLRARISAGR